MVDHSWLLWSNAVLMTSQLEAFNTQPTHTALFVSGYRSWIWLDVTRFCEKKCQPSKRKSLHGRPSQKQWIGLPLLGAGGVDTICIACCSDAPTTHSLFGTRLGVCQFFWRILGRTWTETNQSEKNQKSEIISSIRNSVITIKIAI